MTKKQLIESAVTKITKKVLKESPQNNFETTFENWLQDISARGKKPPSFYAKLISSYLNRVYQD